MNINFPWHPDTISAENPAKLKNFADGRWIETEKYKFMANPMNGDGIILMPDTQEKELEPFIASLRRCPKYGLHNPLLNTERYRMYGDICRNAAQFLRSPEGRNFFAKLISLVFPKGDDQCVGEVDCIANFLETFSGHNVRFLAFGQTTPGDNVGHEAHDYRWPYGPVSIITPFNFPLEIMAMQLLGALFMGNKPVLKQASTTSIVAEAFVRLLLACGMPADDMALIHCGGSVMEKLVTATDEDGELIIQMNQFTGGSDVAHRLLKLTAGRVKIEDAGFDWKIIGPDVDDNMVGFIATQSDKDAYAAAGQKCSAQSILFVHENWMKTDLLARMGQLALKRDFTMPIIPILTWNNEQIFKHIRNVCVVKGAKLLFGGHNRVGNKIPICYGSFESTAVFVPLEQIMPNFQTVTKELFGPFQIVTSYNDQSLDLTLAIVNRLKNHLTAGIVSNDPDFYNHVLGRTTNGVTYVGMRARTTGAPEWHHFGPTGANAAAIGTRKAIIDVWSQQRGVVFDTRTV
ncbi:MAG: hypothetical protein US76_02385 [Parcubacteria group bacterium GW2011_GWA2_38_13b]|nr:MAG: hypothetical protein US76_02385 [Parcubacteria group bacterium GW2011_GWA2_38_13b]